MRHRAPRPLLDLWHRLPRAAAHRLERAAQRLPVRALVGLMVVASLGIGGYVAVAAMTEGSSTHATDTANPPAVRDPESPDLTTQAPESEDQTLDGSSPEPDGSRSGQPQAPSSSDVTSPTESEAAPDQVTGSPSTDSTTPSPSPSQTSESAPRTPADTTPADSTPSDTTPPNTSLSEEFPEPDAAQFTFTANEEATFTCSLDGADFTPCESRMDYSNLESGWHTFAVRAEDRAGNVESSPARTRWHANSGDSGD